MDLQIDICNDIDENEWNSVVRNSKDGSIFHTIDWVNLLEKEYGEKVLIGAWLNGKLVGVFPSIISCMDSYTTHIRSYTLTYEHGGPISINADPQIIRGMVLKFEEIAKDKADKATIVTPCNWNFTPELERVGFSKRLESTFIVDLKKPINELWQNIKKGTKRSVKKAQKNRITIRSATKRSEMETYYNMFVETMNRAGIDPSSRSNTFYYGIWDQLCEKGSAKIFFAELNDEIISGKLLFLFGKTITAFCSGTISEYRIYQPNSLLAWHVIEWGHKNGYEYFDLGGGTNVPNLYEFKRSWGGDLIDYYILTKNYPSIKYRLSALYYGIRHAIYNFKKKFIEHEASTAITS
ncbi:MAG: lipid II:glycine glycyltransferase FemX [Promethearchaeota archaeon]